MGPAEYLDRLRIDGAALGGAGREAPSAPVRVCPGWDMTALVGHVGGIHHWVADIVRTGATAAPATRASPPDPGDAGVVLAWYDQGLAALVSLLDQADPDGRVWNWFDRGPAPARFWYRRMAHETAVHRWDAEDAAGHPSPLDAALAVDGIDEFLTFVASWLPRSPVAGLSGTLHLHATDTDHSAPGEWLVTLAPDRLALRHEHAKGDAALRGSASDLLLWLLNRKPADADGLTLFGDRSVTDAWRANIGF
jgi:uncharacterized protein (TIGR03083 family)